MRNMLSYNECNHFYALRDAMIRYVHKKMKSGDKLITGGSVEDDSELYDEDVLFDTMQKAWADQTLIEDYIRENPNNFKEDDLDILRSWAFRVSGYFVAFKYMGGVALLKHNTIFLVKGLSDPIDRLLGKGSFPMLVETVLLPFKDKIVYHGFFSHMPISYGEGIQKMFMGEIDEALAKGEVVSAATRLMELAPIMDKMDSEAEEARIAEAEEQRKQEMEPIEGCHRGVLADMDWDERNKAVDEYVKEMALKILSGDEFKDAFNETNGYSNNQKISESSSEGSLLDLPSGKKGIVQNVTKIVSILAGLRGAVDMEDAYKEYLRIYPEKLEKETFERIIYTCIEEEISSESVLETDEGKKYILDYELADYYCEETGSDYSSVINGSLDPIKGLLDEQKTKPVRPIDEEMLQYDDLFFWKCDLPEVRDMIRFLDEHVPDGKDDYLFADKLIEELVDYFSVGSLNPTELVENCFDILNENEFYPDEAHMNQVLGLIMNIVNALPIWENNGWSPQEMREIMNREMRDKAASLTSPKIGRNAPCPCGSGKKYKHCCGRTGLKS